ncbi:MAG: sigma-70 family RNA polymerase sigma factor [Pyrinomonadaceae bacterium]
MDLKLKTVNESRGFVHWSDLAGVTDEVLVEQCRVGNEHAWETLVGRYQNLLYSIVLRTGVDTDAASDVLQDVFVTLFRKIETLESPEYVRAWLITTTRHKTINLIQRHLKVRPDQMPEDVDGRMSEPPDLSATPEELLLETETERQIESALEALDERCRRLLGLLYLCENTLSYDEVARSMEMPVGSIGPTRARCVAKLVEFMSD